MKTRGFTLIEVMVAMAIFAVSAMAILSATGQNINTLGAIEKKTIASMVADNQLAIMTLSGIPTEERSGSTQMASETWHWTIRPVSIPGSPLRAIDIIVWSDEKKSSSLITVRTYGGQ